MIDGVREIEPRLKEVLYRCLEEIQATKAALYLVDDKEQFELVTEYGFRGNLRNRYNVTDDMIDRLVTKRTAYFLNGLTADPRFSELLYNSDTTRMLVAPIYSRGRLVGLIDMRDKARQAPFEQEDIRRAQAIGDELLEVFSQNNLYGQKPVAEQPRAVAPPTRELQSVTSRVIEEATAALARGILRKQATAQVTSDRQVNAASLILPAIVGLPGVVLAAVSPIGRLGGMQVVAARSEILPGALEQLDGKVRAWLKKRGESAPVNARLSAVYPYGTAGPPIDASRLVSVLSAPVRAGGVDGLVLTVAFEMNPDAAVKANLEKLLASVEQLVSYSSAAETLAQTRQRIAEKLVEPDFGKFSSLVAHSARVSDLAEQLAQFIGLSEHEVETIRLAGYVHDVGMRLLDYRSLYRKPTLLTDEMRIMKSHPVVGAALVADSPLGPEIGSLVLSHHERPDGTGYPDQLSADAIPLGSRIIHICEAFDAMTSTDSYQPAVAPASAVAKIKRAAGTQFDAELSSKFGDMLAVG